MTKIVHINNLWEAEQWFPDEIHGKFIVIEDPYNKGYYKNVYQFIKEGSDKRGVIYTPERAEFHHTRTMKDENKIPYTRDLVHWMNYGEWLLKGEHGYSFISHETFEREFKEVIIE